MGTFDDLDELDKLWEENPRIRRIVERATAQKVATLAADVTAQVTERVTAQVTERVTEQIKTQAVTREMQQAVIELIQARFPQLVRLAQGKVSRINQPSALHTLIARVGVAPDEDAVRDILMSSAP